MSLPSIQELLVDLKDLGNFVQDIKGAFPFVLNEKESTTFEQKWMDTLHFDGAFLSSLEKNELLQYVDEPESTEDVDTANQLIEDAPTAANIQSNEFRKGIQGVYRVSPSLFSNKENIGLNMKDLHNFGGDEISAKPANLASFEKPFESMNINLFVSNIVAGINAAYAANVAAAVPNVLVAAPKVVAPVANFGHRNLHPQIVLPNPADDVDLLDALMDQDVADLLAEVELPPVVEQKEVDLPPPVPVRDDIAFDDDVNELLDLAELPPVVVQKDTNLPPVPVRDESDSDVEVDELLDLVELPPVVVQQDDDLPPPVPVRDESDSDVEVDELLDLVELPPVVEQKEVDLPPPVPVRDDITSDDEVNDLLNMAELPPVIDTKTEMPVATVIKPVVEVVDNDVAELLADAELPPAMVANGELSAEEMAASAKLLSELPLPEFTVKSVVDTEVEDLLADVELPPAIVANGELSAEEMAASAKLLSELPLPEFTVKSVVDTEVEDLLADIVLPPAELQLPPPMVATKELSAEEIAASEKLLSELQPPKFDVDPVVESEVADLLADVVLPVIPTPPPMPGSGKLSTSKPSTAVSNDAKVTPVKTADSKPNINAGKPEFKISGDAFAQRLQEMKANKAAKEAAAKEAAAKEGTNEPEVAPDTVKRSSSLLEAAFNQAFESKKSSIRIEEKQASDSSSDSDVWDDADRLERNLDLINNRVRVKTTDFDLNPLVDEVLLTKNAILTRIVDNYEQKLHQLPAITNLPKAAQDNVVLGNGITVAVNKMQEHLVSALKTHAMTTALGTLQSTMVSKLKVDFKVDNLTSDLEMARVDDTLTQTLQALDDGMIGRLKTVATEIIDEMLVVDEAYLDTDKRPGEKDAGHCKAAVEKLANDLSQDQQALCNIIQAEALMPKQSLEVTQAAQSMWAGLAGVLGLRRAAFEEQVDSDDDSFGDSDDHKETKSSVDVSEPVQSETTVSKFGGLKDLLQGKLFGAKVQESHTDVDEAQVDKVVDSFVDSDVNDLLNAASRPNSGFLSTEAKKEVFADMSDVDDLLNAASRPNSGFLSTTEKSAEVTDESESDFSSDEPSADLNKLLATASKFANLLTDSDGDTSSDVDELLDAASRPDSGFLSTAPKVVESPINLGDVGAKLETVDMSDVDDLLAAVSRPSSALLPTAISQTDVLKASDSGMSDVDDLLGMVSAPNSGYLSTGPGEVVTLSPAMMQQTHTETHDATQGNIFG